MIDSLRRGDFFSAERLRVYPLIVILAYVVALGFLLATSHNGMDVLERPLGTDFSEVYAAGVFVRTGEPAKPFDNAAHAQMQKQIFGPATPFYSWGYPPYFLALAALLASLPYLGALILWQGLSLSVYLASMRRILPLAGALPLALAFPGVFINLAHGQNGFLTAGLMAGGLFLLERRPSFAGILFGLLAYKPQFCVLLPVALVAGRHWKCVAAGMFTVALMTVGTFLAFGIETWAAFLGSLPFSRETVIEQGATGFEKFQTVFGAVRLLGGSVLEAHAVQGAASLACAAVVAGLWRSQADRHLASATLLCGCLLATPYALDYDMMVLGPAIAFLVRHGLERGFRPYEKLILAITWCMPLSARLIAGATSIPIGIICVALLFVWTIGRARSGKAAEGSMMPLITSAQR